MKVLIRYCLLLPMYMVACLGIDSSTSSRDSSTNNSNNDNSNQGNTNNGSSDSDGDISGGSCSNSINRVDGSDGFLWKPVSEADGNLVVLFPESFEVQFQSVKAELALGGLEEGAFGDFGNGNRQHWRFSSPGVFYSGRLIVANPQGNTLEECIWQVTNPGERND